MASSDCIGDACVVEPLERVLADRLEEAVPRLVTGALGDDERLVDQLGDTVEHVDAIDAVAATTASAASRVNPPANTPRRSRTARSSGVRRS